MAELEMKDQLAALVTAIHEQTAKLDGLSEKMETVEAKAASLEEIKPALIDLALWKPKVDQAVGALQVELGDMRLTLDRLANARTASSTTALPASPSERRPDLRVKVGGGGPNW